MAFGRLKKNTVDLLGQSAHQTVAAASDKVKAHLKPAEFQAKFIADWLARKEISPDKPLEFEKILIAALAAAPQIEAILFINTKMQSIGAGHEDGAVGVTVFKHPVSQNAVLPVEQELLACFNHLTLTDKS